MTLFTALNFKIYFFVIGLILGSFLNVVSLRYRGQGRLFKLSELMGRSFCPRCRHKLRWFELLPVISFIFQFRKCRSCRQPISWQYPLVELASGFALLLPFYFESVSLGIVWTLATLALILMAAIDWRLHIIPDEINFFLMILGIGSIFLNEKSFLKNYADLFYPIANPFFNHLTAVIVSLIFLGFIIVASSGKAMGIGDLKLSAALGLLLGWPDIVLALVISFLTGALWGLFLILLRKENIKSAVAFGPFLALGALLTILNGHQILSWYFSFF